VCMLAIVNIFMSVLSDPEILQVLSHKVLVLCLYSGLVLGMVFSVYRLCNIIREQMVWATQIGDRFLRNELLSHRGKLSEFIVDSEGNICYGNRNFVIAVHIISAVLLFLPIIVYLLG